MRPVSELYGRHAGEDVYVIGSGTSIRVFPIGLLEGRITIGLNMAWRSAPVRYAITIHPDLNIPEFTGAEPHPEITWIVPREKSRALLTPEQFSHADAHFFNFNYDGKPNTQPPDQPADHGRVVDWVRRPTDDKLYVWSSIAQTGANLAANLAQRTSSWSDATMLRSSGTIMATTSTRAGKEEHRSNATCNITKEWLKFAGRSGSGVSTL